MCEISPLFCHSELVEESLSGLDAFRVTSFFTQLSPRWPVDGLVHRGAPHKKLSALG